MKQVLYLLSILFVFGCNHTQEKLTVILTNTSDFDRTDEIVEIEKERINKVLKLSEKETFIVVDDKNNQVPFQILTAKNTVIFLANVLAEGSSSFIFKKGTPDNFPNLVYGKLVPERKDDFAWENNKVAFRMYGPALQVTGEISNGIDFWAKRTEKLIIDKWYKEEFAGIKTYHTDGGEGLDFYKVGHSLGVGATAPFVYDKIVLGNNFVDYKIIEKGPLRFVFELKYAPLQIGEYTVSEKRTISLDAYSHLNKITEHFEPTPKDFLIATGLVLRNEKDKKKIAQKSQGILAYEEPENVENGIIYTGVMSPKGFLKISTSQGHLLGVAKYEEKDGFTYYAGAGWNKFGINSLEDWQKYLLQEKKKFEEPLKIIIE